MFKLTNQNEQEMAKRGYKDRTGIAMAEFDRTISLASKAELKARKRPITLKEQIEALQAEKPAPKVEKVERARFVPGSRAFHGLK